MKRKIFVLMMSVVLIASMGFLNAETAEPLGDRDQTRDRTQEQLHDGTCDCVDCTEERLQLRIHNFEDMDTLNNLWSEAQLRLNAFQKGTDVSNQEMVMLKGKMDDIDAEILRLRQELRNQVRANYSEEELSKLYQVRNELQNQFREMIILDVDSVICNRALFKFDTLPVIKNNRTLVPLRALAEGLGAKVQWEEKTRTILIHNDGLEIQLQLNNRFALRNGETIELDTEAAVMNSRTLVPLRFIAEAFNMTVRWNSDDQTIEIIE